MSQTHCKRVVILPKAGFSVEQKWVLVHERNDVYAVQNYWEMWNSKDNFGENKNHLRSHLQWSYVFHIQLFTWHKSTHTHKLVFEYIKDEQIIHSDACTEHIHTHTHLGRWDFACMVALPLAVATVARLRAIQDFGGDLTLGRANWPQEALICREKAAAAAHACMPIVYLNIYSSPCKNAQITFFWMLLPISACLSSALTHAQRRQCVTALLDKAKAKHQ